MMDLQIGQVLTFRARFNNNGDISKTVHPYLIVDIKENLNVIEVAQFDSMEGKLFKSISKTNCVVYSTHPDESVIKKDSFIQLDNRFTIERFEGLSKFRNTTEVLSASKLEKVLRKYKQYHQQNEIDENKIIYMDRQEILELNCPI